MEYIIFGAVIFYFVWRFKPSKGVKSITTEQLNAILDDHDKVFIDVRTPREYHTRCIRQFQNMPLGAADFSRLPKDKEIVVICQSGMRSNTACKQLVQLGFENVTNVRRGMSGVKK